MPSTADRRRQLWINGAQKWCDHRTLSEVRAEGGALLAELCAACQIRIAEYGKCDGCDRDRRLVTFVKSKRKRYCSEDCLAAKNARDRAEREAKAEAAAAKEAARWPKL